MLSVLPMQLHIGDLIRNEDGDWEVASRPVTFKRGHEVRARVQRPCDPGTDSREWAKVKNPAR